MQIQIFAAHWGHHELEPQVFIDRAKAAGFDGIEMSLPLDAAQRDDWTRRIADAGLALIVGQWETVFHKDFAPHKAALAELLHNACAARPLHINSQTGKDFFTPEQNRELLDLADDISRQHGVPIYHEIHRSRFSGHPMLLLPYLQQMPNLHLTADLSHWCCACETLLEDQPETLARTLPQVRHIHARVGHAQGPQVADFRAPESQAALEAHLSWWDEVIRLRREAGAERMTLTPEFGPVPYTQTLPYTQKEVSNAWELNVAMLALLRQRYA
ncbi:Sugar phosphate isomerase/epimerase [Duganella sp. CF402]|uniref:sugar phosphate isomerase/epimerase family protein n=1 Tax=unclassified Duganella TaxID=2636909 RepID=UPI0008D0DEAD|nr:MULTISPECIES: TIM barrel protein [unclassified Duganella]RZT08791.1 sugar phosphate isomerase/epimerase [Duganella sp. BK701]SEL81865.1 Sugar phosphate isomerase/epimerase [Duganella sp. CF402]